MSETFTDDSTGVTYVVDAKTTEERLSVRIGWHCHRVNARICENNAMFRMHVRVFMRACGSSSHYVHRPHFNACVVIQGH